ncbi:hypothetical protein GQ55_5G346800 [Panicum hallii var. hallii]|uniref:Uncharacterized protein n=1 Tax=Panicum hallii var. hallii TaxID=1504633 RepID=A0A2T7DM99_9POAL|nr:hypothetical protein GQ55_5G346800 [Panicum hallii var. hallii]
MDAWMNRYRAFAEGVVIMVCPVLLAISLKKVDLNSEEHGRATPITMLVVATITLTAGICPFLVCCFSKRFSRGSSSSPHTLTKLLAPLSSTLLVALACWIIYLILNNWAYPVIGAVIGLCSMIRTVKYFRTSMGDAATRDEEYSNELENSLDFLAGITALLFLGLEGLALEGQIKSTKIVQDRLTTPIVTSFFVCVVDACLMLVETMPPHNITSNLIEIFDLLTVFSVSMVIFFIMYSLMKLRALLLIAAPFLILLMHVFHVAISGMSSNGTDTDGAPSSSSSSEEHKPASLELSKVTFTGFLAVSIPSISNGSLDSGTECFLHLAASAIVSGLIWRLLTHYKSHTTITAVANVASFYTHLCVAIATFPFTIMAGKALS